MHAQEFFQDIPLLHSWDGGHTWNSGGFLGWQLEAIVSLIKRRFPAPRIIETGAGNSTISFLFCNAAEVVSICPEKELFDRIIDYCGRHSIPTGPLRTIVGRSEVELPDIARQVPASGEYFDFALIDGSHNWPAVFVDFCYIYAATREGSLIMVDDVQLYSAQELANLLREQPGFELVKNLGKAMIFRKTTNAIAMPEWIDQPYIVRNSKSIDALPPIESGLRRGVKRAVYRLPYAPSIIKAVKRIARS